VLLVVVLRKKTVTIMASTSGASRKRAEDAEIFQILEESTDSDVTIFSSEEDEDGNEMMVKKFDNKPFC